MPPDAILTVFTDQRPGVVRKRIGEWSAVFERPVAARAIVGGNPALVIHVRSESEDSATGGSQAP
jgi:acetyltransferase-like isoleucine patch superfamily enzyme